MGTVSQFDALVSAHGSDVLYSRSDAMISCPCRTPEGFRDPEWHYVNPTQQVCDEDGMLPDSANTLVLMVKAFVQPIQSTRATRLQTEYFTQMFGEVEADDHLGIFPCAWQGHELNFSDWPQTASSFVSYVNQPFLIVNANLIPDPSDGNPRHHWECGLRLISDG